MGCSSQGWHYANSSDHTSQGLLQSGQLMALGFPLEMKLKIVGLCFTESLGSADLLCLQSLSWNPLTFRRCSQLQSSPPALPTLAPSAPAVFLRTSPAPRSSGRFGDLRPLRSSPGTPRSAPVLLCTPQAWLPLFSQKIHFPPSEMQNSPNILEG